MRDFNPAYVRHRVKSGVFGIDPNGTSALTPNCGAIGGPARAGRFRAKSGCEQSQQGSRRGRDTHYWVPPAQIRTCSFPAYGSYLGYETANRLSGQG